MNTLFPVEPLMPEGFYYFPDFINQDEEMQLIREISDIQLSTFIFQGFEAKRKVASFGYDWNFEKRRLSKGKQIPAVFNPVIEKAETHLSLKRGELVEVLITEYPLDSVINWHRDAPPFDVIAGISLFSDCIFRFRPHDKAKQSRHAVLSLRLERRSLYVIKGPARTVWQHSILPVKHVRYSITLRTLKTNGY